jgi:hypothetical protein
MVRPGWLQVGLHLRSKETPNDLFRVTKIVQEFVELEGINHPEDNKHRTKIDYLHAFYWASDYFECDDCRRKPGAPTLCSDCLRRREEFYSNGRLKCELPRFYSKPYNGYPTAFLPMGLPNGDVPVVRLSRYQRKWVV